MTIRLYACLTCMTAILISAGVSDIRGICVWCLALACWLIGHGEGVVSGREGRES